MENFRQSIQFQEAYKRLDALCKDCLSSEKGVTEYIEQMERIPWNAHSGIPNWESDFKALKHVRWVRNKLAHEVDTLESDLCQESDIRFVLGFHDRILQSTDPLALLRQQQRNAVAKQKAATPSTSGSGAPQRGAKPSRWERFVATVKNFFRG